MNTATLLMDANDADARRLRALLHRAGHRVAVVPSCELAARIVVSQALAGTAGRAALEGAASVAREYGCTVIATEDPRYLGVHIPLGGIR